MVATTTCGFRAFAMWSVPMEMFCKCKNTTTFERLRTIRKKIMWNILLIIFSWLCDVKVVLSCPTLCNPMDWTSPGQNTGVDSLSFLQGIFPTQGLNSGLPHFRQILYQLSHKGSPRILEWVAYPFSSGSSQPRNWTGVSCIAGGFFTNWAMREALLVDYILK